MSRLSVERSIENIKNTYKSYIMTDNVDTKGTHISWYNYKPGIITNLSYPREYQILLDSGQYSFLLKDNSFFQFYFQYCDEGHLKKCRLAYYPAPVFTKETAEDVMNYMDTASDWLAEALDEVILDMIEHDTKLTQTSHLRFDYDDNVESHSKCHLQFGGINNFRISSKVIILPFLFVEKILSDFCADWLEEIGMPRSREEAKAHALNNCYEFPEEDTFVISR
ncbi:DUF2290 domain-containing protein [Vibrio cyclitrophicus]